MQVLQAVEGDTVTIRLPDAPKDADPKHTLELRQIAEAKLVMTDALMDQARADQDAHPIDEDDEIETVEISDTAEAEEETH